MKIIFLIIWFTVAGNHYLDSKLVDRVPMKADLYCSIKEPTYYKIYLMTVSSSTMSALPVYEVKRLNEVK